MAVLSMATLGMGVAHGRRLAGRPGMAMAIAVIVAMITAAVRQPHLLIPSPANLSQLRWREWWLEFWFTVPRLSGFAVAVSWLTLAFCGRWRAGAGWPDRLGVFLGVVWIGMAAADLAATWLLALPL
jgi:hypothetical protein